MKLKRHRGDLVSFRHTDRKFVDGVVIGMGKSFYDYTYVVRTTNGEIVRDLSADNLFLVLNYKAQLNTSITYMRLL